MYDQIITHLTIYIISYKQTSSYVLFWIMEEKDKLLDID